MISSSSMKRSAVIILILNSLCTFSHVVHETVTVIGCSNKNNTVVQFEGDGDEVLYTDFEKEEFVFTVPKFITSDPSEVFGDIAIYKKALKSQSICATAVLFCTEEERHPPEAKDAPETMVYAADEVQLGVENTLICFVNHFYPPFIEVTWTKNGQTVTEGVSLGRYYPNNELTFHQLSSLTFTPDVGDIYSCTVEHLSLERPDTKFWEPDFGHQSHGPDILCWLGLTFAFLGVAAGTFLFVKGHHVRG
ncbi:H-2 class II histocompatibility antigen, A-U alpha chain-like [Solea solea]|uniref:H-2 class II histocompatibility antigen, A-U alpha chain-like n=1 Tax=Solea solea TaxID=90069 RepID=UPI002729B27A|nr:H-2 class II histocompatibility antigen, A-U alpha chain-like [Solea solea]